LKSVIQVIAELIANDLAKKLPSATTYIAIRSTVTRAYSAK
jgi:hypothetical protein